MRWDELFDDLEAQLESGRRAERALEVADRTRRERATRDLRQRLVDQLGSPVTLEVAGGRRAEGELLEVGADWVLLGSGSGSTTLVPLPAVRSAVLGAQRRGRAEATPQLSRRLSLGHALRVLSRDRAPVRLVGVDGGELTGTIDAVGADLLDLSEHPLDLPRRRGNVPTGRLVPFVAVAMVVRGR